MRNICLRTSSILLASLVLIAPVLWVNTAHASQLLDRAIVVGSSLPSINTRHDFSFTIATVGTIGSIEFEYCTNSPLVGSPCTVPAGLNVSAAVITSQAGETGFSIDPATTNNRIVITRAPSANSAIPVSYVFSNITNQSTSRETVFVRMSSFASTDGTGPRTDDGTVAYSTADNVTVSGYVPPFLIFCVGVTVAGNCSSANGQSLNFGELKSKQPSFLTSQFAGATNDPGGYSTFVNGLTMTSGTNIIPALSTPQPSQIGVSQFGMNLNVNTNPSVGNSPSGIGSSVVDIDFSQPNLFVFKNQVITTSTTSTDFNLFTASYIVNVSPNQPAGIYNTTLTYIATAAF